MNINFRYILALAVIANAFVADGKTVTPGQALIRANATPAMKAMAAGKTAGSMNPALVYTQFTEKGSPAAYIFNNAAGKGYMVLAGDDVAWPVLGYSDNGKIEDGAIPPQLEWWLQEYARQIDYAVASGSTSLSDNANPVCPKAPAIAPLIKTHWDQGAPYNDKCPLVNGQRAYTGCVATSMAQVMKYFNYPEVGQNSISYNDDEGCGKRLSLNFAQRRFDWSNMLDNYREGQYTDAQAEAVASLMQAAGYSVKMSYAADASGALAMNISRGLIRYFNYDPDMEYALRSYYSSTEWKQKIVDNLANVGPILYGGASMLGGGHSFILDGYDGNGYFHFNWGWSEMSDGYYLLDALNPSSLGAGGGTGGGYNFTQDALFGVQPPTGKPVVERPLQLTQQGALTAEIDAETLRLGLDGESQCMWVNYNPETLKVRLAALFYSQAAPDTDPIAVELSERSFQIQPGYGVPPESLVMDIPVSKIDMPDGKYTIRICTRDNEVENSPWIDVRTNYGYAGTVLLDKNGSQFDVSDVPPVEIKINSANFTHALYIGCSNVVTVEIANNSDIELTRGMAPILFFTDGTVGFLGESALVTLAPGEKVTKTWITDFTAMSQKAAYLASDTEMVFTFYDESTGNMYTGDILKQVTMQANPGAPTLNFSKQPEITNAKKDIALDDENKLKVSYIVSNPADMQIESAFTLQSGIVAYPVVACIVAEENSQYAIETYDGYTLFMSKAGEKHQFKTSVNFSQGEPEKKYYVTMALVFPAGLQAISNLVEFTIESAGVENITDNDGKLILKDGLICASGQDITVINLQGTVVLNGHGSVDTNVLAPGMYIAHAVGESLKFTVK